MSDTITCTCGSQKSHWTAHSYDCAMKLACLLAEERAENKALRKELLEWCDTSEENQRGTLNIELVRKVLGVQT